jgi:hypothetical protein
MSRARITKEKTAFRIEKREGVPRITKEGTGQLKSKEKQKGNVVNRKKSVAPGSAPLVEGRNESFHHQVR